MLKKKLPWHPLRSDFRTCQSRDRLVLFESKKRLLDSEELNFCQSARIFSAISFKAWISDAEIAGAHAISRISLTFLRKFSAVDIFKPERSLTFAMPPEISRKTESIVLTIFQMSNAKYKKFDETKLKNQCLESREFLRNALFRNSRASSRKRGPPLLESGSFNFQTIAAHEDSVSFSSKKRSNQGFMALAGFTMTVNKPCLLSHTLTSFTRSKCHSRDAKLATGNPFS